MLRKLKKHSSCQIRVLTRNRFKKASQKLVPNKKTLIASTFLEQWWLFCLAGVFHRIGYGAILGAKVARGGIWRMLGMGRERGRGEQVRGDKEGTEGAQMDREEKGWANEGTKGGTKLLGTHAHWSLWLYHSHLSFLRVSGEAPTWKCEYCSKLFLAFDFFCEFCSNAFSWLSFVTTFSRLSGRVPFQTFIEFWSFFRFSRKVAKWRQRWHVSSRAENRTYRRHFSLRVFFWFEKSQNTEK